MLSDSQKGHDRPVAGAESASDRPDATSPISPAAGRIFSTVCDLIRRPISPMLPTSSLISVIRQSPLIALMNTLAWRGQAGQQRKGCRTALLTGQRSGGRERQAGHRPVGSRPAEPLWMTRSAHCSAVGKHGQQCHVGRQHPEPANLSDPYHPPRAPAPAAELRECLRSAQEMMHYWRRPSSGEKRRPDRHATIW